MKNEKVKLIGYWIITILLAANYAFAGVVYLIQNKDVVEGARVSGYPLYFFSLLGVWKLIAAVVLVIPKTPLLKEWAYAGILINLTAAAYSNFMSKMETQHIILPLVMLIFAAASWYLRPETRKLVK